MLLLCTMDATTRAGSSMHGRGPAAVRWATADANTAGGSRAMFLQVPIHLTGHQGSVDPPPTPTHPPSPSAQHVLPKMLQLRWSELPPIPTGAHSPFLGLFGDGQLVVGAGQCHASTWGINVSGLGDSGSVHSHGGDVESPVWVPQQSFPGVLRQGQATATMGGAAMIGVGGHGCVGSRMGDTHEHDDTDTPAARAPPLSDGWQFGPHPHWQQLAVGLPRGLNLTGSGICSLASGAVYLFGGADYNGTTPCVDRPCSSSASGGAAAAIRVGSSLWRLDAAAATGSSARVRGWERLAPSPGTPRFNPAFACTATHLYVLGGATVLEGRSADFMSGAAGVADSWKYSIADGVWARVRDAPVSATGVGQASVFKERYIILVAPVFRAPRTLFPGVVPGMPGTLQEDGTAVVRHIANTSRVVTTCSNENCSIISYQTSEAWDGNDVAACLSGGMATVCGAPQLFNDVFVYDTAGDLWGFADALPTNMRASKPHIVTSLPFFKMAPTIVWFETCFASLHPRRWVQNASRIHNAKRSPRSMHDWLPQAPTVTQDLLGGSTVFIAGGVAGMPNQSHVFAGSITELGGWHGTFVAHTPFLYCCGGDFQLPGACFTMFYDVTRCILERIFSSMQTS